MENTMNTTITNLINDFAKNNRIGKARVSALASKIIENCAHPDYRPMLREYLKFAEKGHEPQSMRAALAMHDTFLKKGDMRLTDFGEYLK